MLRHEQSGVHEDGRIRKRGVNMEAVLLLPCVGMGNEVLRVPEPLGAKDEEQQR